MFPTEFLTSLFLYDNFRQNVIDAILYIFIQLCQHIFSFRSFEISEGILRNQKIMYRFDIFGTILDCTSVCIDYPVVERCKIK